MDRRLKVFLSHENPEIFHSITHRQEIWKSDPFDVERIHAEARETFRRLLSRATTPPGLDAGRILLLLGESGSGKSHLVRAFRNEVHDDGGGFVAYMQMTTSTQNYGRYVLVNLVDSLDQPYNEVRSTEISGLLRLSRAIASRCVSRATLARLRDESLEGEELHEIIREAADALLGRKELADVDLDLVRALLYLQRDDARIKARVLKYLRCEDLSDHDRKVLGDIVPRRSDDDPGRLVEALGKLVWRVAGRSLVLAVDQLEDMWTEEGAPDRFRKAMMTLCALSDRVPSSVIVVCCLEDFYETMKQHLTASMRDRLERDPDPVRLTSERAPAEIRMMIGRRLAHLYELADVRFDPSEATHPLPERFVESLDRLRSRDVLDECRRFRERSIELGVLATPLPARAAPRPQTGPPSTLSLEQAWNDFRATFTPARPDVEDEGAVSSLVAWGLSACAKELENGLQFATEALGETVEVDVIDDGLVLEGLLLAVCNRSARGGGLATQLAALCDAAGHRIPVVVRSTAFPAAPKSRVAAELGRIITMGGRRAILEDSAALAILQVREFMARHAHAPELGVWLRNERPLTQLAPLRDILALDGLDRSQTLPGVGIGPPLGPGPRSARGAAPAPRESEPAAPKRLLLGTTEGPSSRPLELDVSALRSHALLVGAKGSGKTELAANLIEQLVIAGIPVIVVDRSGGLCRYARAGAGAELADDEHEARRALFLARADVALYTPGQPAGRALSAGLAPDGPNELSAEEQEQELKHAAQALGDLMGYGEKPTGRDASCRAVLHRALEVLAEAGTAPTIAALSTLIEEKDPALVAASGRFDAKLFSKLVQDLTTLEHTRADVLEPTGERIDIDELLRAPGDKTRLSIVSTRFLGDASPFWVSQLLLSIGRWSSRRPSDTLRAAVIFDQADLYVPASGKPVTKGPMESLLRRARARGLAVLLSSQGELDDRCRDGLQASFVGGIAPQGGGKKTPTLLADLPNQLHAELAGLEAGQFFLVRPGEVTRFQAARPAIAPERLADEDLIEQARRSARSPSGAA
jgi:energy-coupling factor transporter ATP-binding protein EcfA2